LSFAANDLALRALDEVIAPALDPLRYELRIIGACPPAVPRKYRNLKFTGYVPSILDSIRDSDLSVFPLAISVGFPNKAMESLAAGVPFIATPDVANGLPAFDEIAERGVYVRDIAGFVSQIDLYSRLSLAERQEISHCCYQYVQRVYGSSSRRTQWERILTGPLCGAHGQD
jgi:glycosyltransferase involved in cell wall biosynthesis